MKFQNYKSGMHLAKSVVFGFRKILRKEKKKERKMIFYLFFIFIFSCLMKNIKENQI